MHEESSPLDEKVTYSSRKLAKNNLCYQEEDVSTEGSPYHWSLTEQKKYVNFVAERRETFVLCSKDKRVKGIHQKMSKFIKSRNSTQCRSHHQKMLQKFETVDGILENMKKFIYKKNLVKLNRITS